MHIHNSLDLKEHTERLVLSDLALQDPLLMFRKVDISVILVERRDDDWMALVDVRGADVDKRFFEIRYILEDGNALVTLYRPLQYNPYTTEGYFHAA